MTNRVCYDPPPMNTPVREGETIEGSRTMRNRPYPVLKCSSTHQSSLPNAAKGSTSRILQQNSLAQHWARDCKTHLSRDWRIHIENLEKVRLSSSKKLSSLSVQDGRTPRAKCGCHLFAVSLRFSLQPSCHLAVSPFSQCCATARCKIIFAARERALFKFFLLQILSCGSSFF